MADSTKPPCTCWERGATGIGQRHTLCAYPHDSGDATKVGRPIEHTCGTGKIADVIRCEAEPCKTLLAPRSEEEAGHGGRTLDERIEANLDDCIEAFFGHLASVFPEISSGDFAPHDLWRFEEAARSAARAWVFGNLNCEVPD